MRKRKLQLDKEILVALGSKVNNTDAGNTIIELIETILLSLEVASELDPAWCDCLRTGSCQSNACPYSEVTNCTHNDLC